MSTKQRMISPADLETLATVPDVAKPSAMWLWLNLDPLGRGRMDPRELSAAMYPTLDLTPDEVFENLVLLTEAGFLTTFVAPDPETRESVEWLLLLRPLKIDLRDTRISTPEPPPHLSHGVPMAMGGGARGRAGARGSARERARAQVRAEDAARADAWDAVQRDREVLVERPERPAVLDAPPMFCDEHMPHGAGQKKCGPCRDRRLLRDEWLQRRVYEDRLAGWHEQNDEDDGEGVWGEVF